MYSFLVTNVSHTTFFICIVSSRIYSCTLLRKCHSSFVTVFISKNVETNCSVVPITFPGMTIPNSIPGTGHGEGVRL